MTSSKTSDKYPHDNHPKTFALGGGRGLKNLLMGLYAENPGAGSTVSDDGGDAGKCVELFGRTSICMGDIRRALTALSPASVLSHLFEYRIQGNDPLSDLNMEKITAMTFMQNGVKPERILEILEHLRNDIDLGQKFPVGANGREETVDGYKYGNLLLGYLQKVYPNNWPYIVREILHTNGSVFPVAITPLQLRVYVEGGDGEYFVERDLDDHEGPAPPIIKKELVPLTDSPYVHVEPFEGVVDFVRKMGKGDRIIISPGSHIASRWASLYPVREIVSEAISNGAGLILMENAMYERRQTTGDGWKMTPEEMVYDILAPLTLPPGYQPLAVIPDVRPLELDRGWGEVLGSYENEGGSPIKYPDNIYGVNVVGCDLLGIKEYTDLKGTRSVIGHDPRKMKTFFKDCRV